LHNIYITYKDTIPTGLTRLDDIKSKLDRLSRKHLIASVNLLMAGIELLYKVFDKARSKSEGGEVPIQTVCAEVFALADDMREVKASNKGF